MISIVCVFAYFNRNGIDSYQTINIYKTNGFNKLVNTPIMTISDEDKLNEISTILNKSEKISGILNVAAPEFLLEIHSNKSIKTLYLWLGKDNMKGLYIFKSNTETGYCISTSDTAMLRKLMVSIKVSKEPVNGICDLKALNIELPTNLHLDTKDKSQYIFVDSKGKNNGWVICEKFNDDAFSGWKPNHCEIVSDELIATSLGKCRVFTLDADNGTATSGITGTHNDYYAIIPVRDNRYIIEFSKNDKSLQTKGQFIKILKNLSLKS